MTVPKRRLTRQQSELTAITQIASTLEHQWPAIVAVYAALAAPTLRAAGNSSGGRSSDPYDPTFNVVASYIAMPDPDHPNRIAYDDIIDAIHAWHEQGRWIRDQLRPIYRQHPDVEAIRGAFARENTCSGAVNPACRREVEPGRTICAACRKRRERERTSRRNVPGPDLRILDNVPGQGVETARLANADPIVDDYGRPLGFKDEAEAQAYEAAEATVRSSKLPDGYATLTATCPQCDDFYATASGVDTLAMQTDLAALLRHHRAAAHSDIR